MLHFSFSIKSRKDKIYLQSKRMDDFFITYAYLVEHTDAPVRRLLMDEIDWNNRMIGIKGTRGVGKTTFLLQYAKNNFKSNDRACLYVNMNNFYFQGRGIADFAGEFYRNGGKVLLIDQVFKQPNWSKELRECYDRYKNLKIVFTGSSVMRLKEENPELNDIVSSYNLRGFSFREFLNLQSGNTFRPYTLREMLENHQELVEYIKSKVNPLAYFDDYIHHGFYPFFLENRNFSENLLKTMNMMTEVDILLIKRIGLQYLPKIKKLFYLLAVGRSKAPNISTLAEEIGTSRATVMNYIKYLADARLINIVYHKNESFPKKPAKVMMHNTNLMYAIYPIKVTNQDMMETFFVNNLWKDHVVNTGAKVTSYIIDNTLKCEIADSSLAKKNKRDKDAVRIVYNNYGDDRNCLPLWLVGFLY